MAARKKTVRKSVIKKKVKSSAATVLKWEFPARELHILRIEMFALLVFAQLVFVRPFPLVQASR